MASQDEPSLLDKLDTVAPASLKSFDAFPKLPTTYKSRSEGRGFYTVLIGLVAFFLILNDITEFIWGWPDYEFGVDRDAGSFMNVNLDIVVNMPCRYLTVDLRDVVGDRLYLSKGFRRDGTLFDVGQATSLKEHAAALSARQAVSQSRKTRGFFAWLGSSGSSGYKKTYNYKPDGGSCRVYGSVGVKKATANLHITTLGHGYTSRVHVPHDQMNLSHVITEFSFGPFFPEIAQPLDNSFELTTDPFVAYQYYLRVVPTTYVAPRSKPLDTNQYSVTHYTRVLSHDNGTPGIFFKFDIDPIRLTIIQRTQSFVQFLIRCFGVIGGVFVCASWALRIGSHAVEIVTGPSDGGALAPQTAARASGLRTKWGGENLRARPGSLGRVVRQGNSWVVEGGSPYTSYAGSPASPFPASPYSPAPPSAVPPPPMSARSLSGPSAPSAHGLGLTPGAYEPGDPPASARSPYSPHPAAASPLTNYSVFPPTPAPGAGFPRRAEVVSV
ncbi:endoplasmic reticulum vesicle transporter-domain-containing protein [Vararia minispora EC-137]|uniref:Endoplasmic reticulum vesicle transporter-domain-containing protein n=1 Tax=Vararia minispora EC-137 TaxID=1314806 RepID=A0ACB8QMI9_9AGAM|nr:endoplasmic reticulum vesicle transporter-domain-containing protein [Vararia minispora EC-137]